MPASRDDRIASITRSHDSRRPTASQAIAQVILVAYASDDDC